MRKRIPRPFRRLALLYRLRCAREDATRHNLAVPLGVWLCEHCPHVSLTTDGHVSHLAGTHA